MPAGKNQRKKICLVTLSIILDTCSIFHTFRQECERANRNAAFFNHCNPEDGKCKLHVYSFTILASVWLQLRQLTLRLHSAEYVLVPRIVHNVTRGIFPPIFLAGHKTNTPEATPVHTHAIPSHMCSTHSILPDTDCNIYCTPGK